MNDWTAVAITVSSVLTGIIGAAVGAFVKVQSTKGIWTLVAENAARLERTEQRLDMCEARHLSRDKRESERDRRIWELESLQGKINAATTPYSGDAPAA